MPDKHALLGPSGAHRWLVCTKAPRLEETLPEKTSEYAEAGRLAHELAELKLRKWGIEPMGARTYNSKLKKLKADPYWNDNMDDSTEFYLDYIKSYCNGLKEKPSIQAEVEVNYSQYVPEGFGTSDCIIIGDGVLHVIDYKNGQGVVVSAENNPQMKLYALGAYLLNRMFFSISRIKTSIVQPLVTRDVSTWECSLEELLGWAESIKEPALKAWNNEGEFVPGEHCKFCRAKATCRANANYQLETEGFTNMFPPLITMNEAGDILKRTRQLRDYVSSLEKYVLEQCLEGVFVPGWKAVEGRSNRTFSDLDAAFNKAKELGYKEEVLYDKKPITLTQFEKLVGKDDFKKNFNQFVIKPAGSPTLVEESDKRDAISNKTTAAEDFK